MRPNLKSLWVKTREECAQTKRTFTDKYFCQVVEVQVSPGQWKKLEPVLRRHAANLPHHLRPDWDPKKGRKAIVSWMLERYTAIHGRLRCETCGSTSGPIFDKVNTQGPRFNMDYRFCSFTCSKRATAVLEKRQATCTELYGVPNVSKSAHFKERVAQIESTRDAEFYAKRLEKTRRTKIATHGSLEEAEKARTKKMIKTNQERFGGNAATCSEDVRRKVRRTVAERYGVRNVSQSPEVMQRIVENTGNKMFRRKTAKVAGRKYTALQGYEPEFLSWFYKKYRRHPESHAVSVPYKHAGKQRRFHPDFAIGNTLIEVKSTYTAGLAKGSLRGYGSYALLKAKFRGAIEAGHSVYLAVWLPKENTCFLRKGPLPKRAELKEEFKSWLSARS